MEKTKCLSFTLSLIFLHFVCSCYCSPLEVQSQACKYNGVKYEFDSKSSQYYLYNREKARSLSEAYSYCSDRYGILALPTKENKGLWNFLDEKLDEDAENAVWLGQITGRVETDDNGSHCWKYKYSKNNATKVYCSVSQSGFTVCQCKTTTDPNVVKIQEQMFNKILGEKDVDDAGFLAQKGETDVEETTTTTVDPKKRGRMNAEQIADDEHNGGTSIVVALSTSLGIACLVGAAYVVTKQRGWNIQEIVSSRMPYNNNREERMTVNGSYSPGQELVDMTSNHRPIHVYEEIVPRGQLALNQLSPQIAVTQDSISNSSPAIPPLNTSYGNSMNTLPELNTSQTDGTYLSPNSRGDLVPGDVRSPLPVATMFKYPMKTKSGKIKEIHYASVETVQTDVEDVGCSSSEKSPGQQVDVAEYNSFNGNSRQRTTNRYSITPTAGQTTAVSANTALPYRVITNDYENERFLRTIMKADSNRPTEMQQQEENKENKQEYSSSYFSENQEVYNEPTYAKINKLKTRSNEDVSSSFENSTYMMPVSTSTPTTSIPSTSSAQHRHDDETPFQNKQNLSANEEDPDSTNC